MKQLLSATILTIGATGLLLGQATPAPPKVGVQGQGRTGGGSSSLSVQVTDKSGSGIGEVAVGVTGPVERSGVTTANGTIAFRSMRPGTYRLRFEREGYVTLERELAMRAQPADVSVSLNPAPAKPAAPPTPPAAATASAPVAAATSRRVVEPRSLSIPDFLDKNLIGSEPQKTTMLACTDGGTAKLLQVREPLNNLQNPETDEMLYVVAGAGVVRIRGQDHKAGPGWFGLIPRTVQHSIRRDGRNPMIAITVAVGAPCADAPPPPR